MLWNRRVFLLLLFFISLRGFTQNEEMPKSSSTYYKKLNYYSSTAKAKKAKFKKVVTSEGNGVDRVEFIEISSGITRWVNFSNATGPVGIWQTFDEKGKLVTETNFDDLVYCEKPKEAKAESVDEKLDQKAEFIGGEAAMYAYLGKKTKYPAYARDHNIQGRVYVQFVILETGEIEFKCIIGEKEPEKIFLDAETMRVINEMPDWTPAVLNGENVKMVFNLPMLFKLK